MILPLTQPASMKSTTKLHRTIRKRVEKAIYDFNMIEAGDRILIGVSGGSDSLALLKMIHDGLPLVTKDFSYIVAHIDMGFDSPPPQLWKNLETHFQSIGVVYEIVHTNIAELALDPNAKKNPCFICSHNRRRKIYELAHKLGCNKIAYGHHKDDIIETLLINILYGRRIEAMSPIQEVFQGRMHIIRPFTYVEEELIKKFAVESKLPVAPKLCEMDGNTRRETVKQMIAQIQAKEKKQNIRENIFKSLRYVNMDIPFPTTDSKNKK